MKDTVFVVEMGGAYGQVVLDPGDEAPGSFLVPWLGCADLDEATHRRCANALVNGAVGIVSGLAGHANFLMRNVWAHCPCAVHRGLAGSDHFRIIEFIILVFGILRRTSCSVRPADEGTRELGRLGIILSELDDPEDELKGAELKVAGHLRLQAPVCLTHQLVCPRLPVFPDTFPDLTV